MQAGASVFEPDDVELAVQAGVDFLKLAARESQNTELLGPAILCGLPLVRSVPWPPSPADLHGSGVWETNLGQVVVTTLAAVQSYPATGIYDMASLPDRLPAPWGWSSHTDHWKDCASAAFYGASMIEKHVRLGPDDLEAAWSIDFLAFSKMAMALKAGPEHPGSHGGRPMTMREVMEAEEPPGEVEL
jgi:sialic acid synthase SpsE